MTFVRVVGRVEVQTSALSGLGAVGNYNQVAVARVVYGGRLYEVPVLTGNALKHWHSVYLAQEYQALGGELLNELCKVGVGYRGYRHDAAVAKLKEGVAKNECEAILDLCNDIHGFLIARDGRSTKRDSLVKVAFMVPVLEESNLETVSKFAVQHNRVVPEEVRAATREQQAMMVFKQEYASGLYGFSISMDLDKVLKPTLSTCNVKETLKNTKVDEEVRRRRVAAVRALAPLLMGSGSKQSRALPVVRVVELLAAVSARPIPNLVHGAYGDYVERSLDVLSAYASGLRDAAVHVLYYGERNVVGAGGVEVRSFKSLREFFDELLRLVEHGGGAGKS